MSENLNKISKITIGDISYDIETSVPPINVTHGELISLKKENKLFPGRLYRITDYVTMTSDKANGWNIKSANKPFDIIVKAVEMNVLSEEAKACHHDGNTYFSNEKLESWKIKYSLENDTSRFSWAVKNGKGVIYYMEDDRGNSFPYDFHNLLFKTDDNNYYYTFSYITAGNNIEDGSLGNYDGCYNNTELLTVNGNKFSIFPNIFKSYSNDPGKKKYWNCNSIGSGSSGNTFLTDTNNNKIGDWSSNNTFDRGFNGNIIGNGVNNNTFSGCIHSIIEHGVSYTSIIGSYLQYIHILSGVSGTAQDILDINISSSSRYETVVEKLSNGELRISKGLAPIEQSISIRYLNLKKLVEDKKLVPGQVYRITDYVTTTIQENTKSAEHQFDILVEAIDKDKLSEDAKVCQHSGDNYFSNCNLSNWEIKYCLNNDSSKYAWANNNDEDVISIKPELVNGNTFLTRFQPEYYILVDEYIGYDLNYRDDPDREDNDYFIEYGREIDPSGNENLCIYKNDITGGDDWGENDADKENMFFYCGKEELGGITYDMWRKASHDNDGNLRWGFTGEENIDSDIYILTNIITDHLKAGKGVIYYMKDEHGNECPYDFKNIKVKRSSYNPFGNDHILSFQEDDTFYYTFSKLNEGEEITDLSVDRVNNYTCSRNIIKSYHNQNDGKQYINKVYYLYHTNREDSKYYCTGNYIGNDCSNIRLDTCAHLEIGNTCDWLDIYDSSNLVLSTQVRNTKLKGDDSYIDSFTKNFAIIKDGTNELARINCCRISRNCGFIIPVKDKDYLSHTNIYNISQDDNTLITIDPITSSSEYTTNISKDSSGKIKVYIEGDDSSISTETTRATEAESELLKRIEELETIIESLQTEINNLKG